MSAIYPVPSTVQHISTHAYDKYALLIDDTHPRCVARVAITRLVQCSQLATDVMLRYHHVRIEAEATYRISESTAGRYVMVIKRGILVTLFPLDN